ncbi:hypothetical protein CEXT_576131 [Caerostris extrusa]|uniref:Uncharacterized protein n=1 Tax=Caerostris extrusa TaxID=172846 RepID=A0AAV4RDA6_CAEEX|nr:hypothetical protein CEXT_576131 [Caerostris extrusa]
MHNTGYPPCHTPSCSLLHIVAADTGLPVAELIADLRKGAVAPKSEGTSSVAPPLCRPFYKAAWGDCVHFLCSLPFHYPKLINPTACRIRSSFRNDLPTLSSLVSASGARICFHLSAFAENLGGLLKY